MGKNDPSLSQQHYAPTTPSHHQTTISLFNYHCALTSPFNTFFRLHFYERSIHSQLDRQNVNKVNQADKNVKARPNYKLFHVTVSMYSSWIDFGRKFDANLDFFALCLKWVEGSRGKLKWKAKGTASWQKNRIVHYIKCWRVEIILNEWNSWTKRKKNKEEQRNEDNKALKSQARKGNYNEYANELVGLIYWWQARREKIWNSINGVEHCFIRLFVVLTGPLHIHKTQLDYVFIMRLRYNSFQTLTLKYRRLGPTVRDWDWNRDRCAAANQMWNIMDLNG